MCMFLFLHVVRLYPVGSPEMPTLKPAPYLSNIGSEAQKWKTKNLYLLLLLKIT